MTVDVDNRWIKLYSEFTSLFGLSNEYVKQSDYFL